MSFQSIYSLYCGVNWNTWKKTTDVLQVTNKVVVVGKLVFFTQTFGQSHKFSVSHVFFHAEKYLY